MTPRIDDNGFLVEMADGEQLIVELPAPEGERYPPRHVMDAASLDALNAALAARRPLLVRGEPGTGKSQLARAAAVLLGRALISHTVDARTDTHDLLFEVDHVARLARAQLLGSLKCGWDEAKGKVAIDAFTRPGPLWWAFDWPGAEAHGEKTPHHAPEGWAPKDGCVVLIDELDKADSTVPNGLLDALGHQQFDVPGDRTVTMKADRHGRPPLVIITTNEERSLPDAFLRRCLVLNLPMLEGDALVALLKKRGAAHFGDCDDAVLTAAAQMVVDDRKACATHRQSPPGTAEYIDLLRVVATMKSTVEEQKGLLTRMRAYALQKHPKKQRRGETGPQQRR